MKKNRLNRPSIRHVSKKKTKFKL